MRRRCAGARPRRTRGDCPAGDRAVPGPPWSSPRPGPGRRQRAGRAPRGDLALQAGWAGVGGDGLARCRPATPSALRGLFLLSALLRVAAAAAPGRCGARPARGKSWRRFRAAPLPRCLCPACRGGRPALAPGAAGAGEGARRRKRGAGNPGLPVEPQCRSRDRLLPPPACPQALAFWIGGETLPSGGRNCSDLV